MGPVHGMLVELAEPVAGDEVQVVLPKVSHQLGDPLRGIGQVSVQGDDDVPLRLCESGLVGPSIALSFLHDRPGPEAFGDLNGIVRG